MLYRSNPLMAPLPYAFLALSHARNTSSPIRISSSDVNVAVAQIILLPAPFSEDLNTLEYLKS